MAEAATVIDKEAIATFIRRYIPCDDCGGWSERFDGVNTWPAAQHGRVRTSPTSVTLRGRENHARSCRANAITEGHEHD